MTDNGISRDEQRERKRQRVENDNVEDKERVVIPAEDAGQDVADIQSANESEVAMKSSEGGGAGGDGEDTEVTVVVRQEKVYPEKWNDSFGRSAADRLTWYYERIAYEGDWEILRPAKTYAIAGNVSEAVLKEVEYETRRIIAELRSAV